MPPSAPSLTVQAQPRSSVYFCATAMSIFSPFWHIPEGDATANQLAEPYRMTLQAVYKHLRGLEEAGLVTRPPGPQPRPVHLEVQVFDLMDNWIERHRRRAEQRYRRLDALLEEMSEEEA